MKIFVILSLLVGTAAFAETDFSILPVKIKCTSKAKSSAAQKFTIDDMDSDSPDSSLSDTSLEDVALTKKTYEVGFSNECDNSYSVTFKVADLVKLKSKKFRFVIGKLDYFDSFLSDANGDDGETENEKVDVYCTL